MPKQKTTKIAIHKAQATNEIAVPTVVINIDDPIPEYETLEEAGRAYGQEARTLGRALEMCLPGGTFDRLAIYLLQRKVSHFIIPHMMPDAEEMPRKLFYERTEQVIRELGFTGWRVDPIVDEITWQAEEAGLCYRESQREDRCQ